MARTKATIAKTLAKAAKEHPKPKGTFKELEKKVGSKRLAGWITQQMARGSKKRVRNFGR
jgi:hypothetical protein